ncbi:MAG TPA: D-glycerate dehydrogenase [Gemmatimonadaceae bacterium]|nr:D-glycerate dehydrogenase [Gemmatimonadaceae bacterium]
MSKPIVVITRRVPAAVEKHAGELFDVRLNPSDTPMSATQLIEAMQCADALMPTVTDKITAEVLNTPGRRVRIVANFGVGYNNIDVAAAQKNGVVVTNTPDVLTDDTADLAIALMLMAARRLGEGEREVRSGAWTGWRPTHHLGTRVSGKTLGILGLGRIGRAVAKRAHDGFNMRVLYFDPPVPIGEAKALGAEPRASIEDVLRESDFVSLHAPATPETRHMINAQTLALMPPHAILINTARGDVVDELALAEALKEKRIAGAGLDVFEKEPSVTPALLGLDNVVLLPHIGSATTETRVAMGERAIDNLVQFFAGKAPRDRVA